MMWPWLDPPRYVNLCTSGFVDDVIFSHNGAHRPTVKNNYTTYRHALDLLFNT